MIRLHFVVEGKTEKAFVDTVLAPHLGTLDLVCDARLVQTSRHKAHTFRGGMVGYGQAKKDLMLWMKQDQKPDAYFTTMFDLYALPKDFPAHAAAHQQADPYDRVQVLEEAFAADLAHPRFVPYIQLHEFEALLLVEPLRLAERYPEHEKAVKELAAECGPFSSPELIDEGPRTAPSKRIAAAVPPYDKGTAGPPLLQRVGLPSLRERCPHFAGWLSKLEALAHAAQR